MPLHRRMTHTSRSDLVLEVIQTVSGLLLVGFLWTHLIFVSSILLGVQAFNTLAHFMEKFMLLEVAVVFVTLTILTHMGAVLRRIPGRWEEQKIIWKHAQTIKHSDTWSWLFQAITGSAMLVLIVIHVVIVVYGGINAELSAARVYEWKLWFYIVLLLLADYHASVGLYRSLVKWGFVKRRTLKKILIIITTITIGLGFIALWVFYKLGGSQ